MRGLTRRWLMGGPADPPARPDSEPASEPDSRPDSPPESTAPALVRRVLAARGMTDPAVIERFCSPRLTDLGPPQVVPGAGEAAARLVELVRAGATIAIYGDYDVDGITSTAILYHMLRTARPDLRVMTYVPHRLEEGYGLNADALRQLREDGADAVVTVDCGITAVEPARVARELGLELFITDHHAFPADGVLPVAHLVHPRLTRQGGAASPQAPAPATSDDLCGAGVAFKLAWCFANAWCGSDRVAPVFRQKLLHLLPLVALGTIADVVPLIGENRVLTSFGLRLMQGTDLVGLNALLEATRLRGESVDAQKVGFVLGPHLNAIGRMGHAAEAVELFTTDDPVAAERIARALAGYNTERQRTQRSIFDEASERAVEHGMTGDDRRIIVLEDESWHAGVVGICCSRLTERFGRPALLLQRQGEVCRGSARSIDGYDIHAALSACAEHLEAFGGHQAAAGLTVRVEALERFVAAITAHANEHIAIDEMVPAIRIDCDAAMNELDVPTVSRLAELSPFGRANRRPVVRMTDVTVTEWPRTMGANGKHLSFRLRASDHGREMRAIWWNAGELVDALPRGARFDMAVEPKLNTWQGRTTVEAEIRDVMPAGAQPG